MGNKVTECTFLPDSTDTITSFAWILSGQLIICDYLSHCGNWAKVIFYIIQLRAEFLNHLAMARVLRNIIKMTFSLIYVSNFAMTSELCNLIRTVPYLLKTKFVSKKICAGSRNLNWLFKILFLLLILRKTIIRRTYTIYCFNYRSSSNRNLVLNKKKFNYFNSTSFLDFH